MENLVFPHGKSNSCGVATGYCGTEDFKVVNTASDKNWRILILNAELNGTNFLLINFYSSNTEQLSTFSTLLSDYNQKSIVFWGDFNLIFDCKSDARGGNPILKKISSETNWNKKKLSICAILGG